MLYYKTDTSLEIVSKIFKSTWGDSEKPKYGIFVDNHLFYCKNQKSLDFGFHYLTLSFVGSSDGFIFSDVSEIVNRLNDYVSFESNTKDMRFSISDKF